MHSAMWSNMEDLATGNVRRLEQHKKVLEADAESRQEAVLGLPTSLASRVKCSQCARRARQAGLRRDTQPAREKRKRPILQPRTDPSSAPTPPFMPCRLRPRAARHAAERPAC